MKSKIIRLCACLVTVAAQTAFSEDSVDWPADFDSNLAAHVAALQPSGEQTAQSAAYAYFDSIAHVDLFAALIDLRNYVRPGFQMFFR